MLRQFQPALSQHFGSVDHRVHQQILIHSEMARLIPSEYLLFREHLMIADCMRCTILHMFIDIIADKHIHTLAILSELFQSIQHNLVAVCIQPVV